MNFDDIIKHSEGARKYTVSPKVSKNQFLEPIKICNSVKGVFY